VGFLVTVVVFERFSSKVHAWTRNLKVESRKQRKTGKKRGSRRHSQGQGGGNPEGLTRCPGQWAAWGDPQSGLVVPMGPRHSCPV